jgi:hypothetical protein
MTALGLTACTREDDVSLRDDDDIGCLEHRTDLLRCVDSAEIVYDTDREDILDVGGAAVAQPGRFADKQIIVMFEAPVGYFLDIGDEIMVGTQRAGKPFLHGDARLLVEQIIIGVQTVKLDDCGLDIPRSERLKRLEDH